ncbi:hypothetical protein AMTRI_Chr01g112910 [Amborella trichopoda]
MFGKFGRGGGMGRGQPKRMIMAPPPHNSLRPTSSRPPGSATLPRRSAITGPQPPAPSSSAMEENFSLVKSEDSLPFGMLIRLAPDLVEEIKRVEALGGTARIKFEPNNNNPSESVIDVGGKDFRFTWAREPEDNCDIYEESRNGEDGNGLLVESGSVWRKLNVQRILDESTRDHVKMRSEEAERKSKSRKSIVLDHGNPSVKNQAKPSVAAPANSRRTPFNKKNDFVSKKPKAEVSPVTPASLPKSVPKPAAPLNSTVAAKSRSLLSPAPSSPEQNTIPLQASATPPGVGFGVSGQALGHDVAAPHVISKHEATIPEKEMLAKPSKPATQEAGHKAGLGTSPMDLRNILITILMENPKGMSLKVLEKAVGEAFPNSGRKIETVIKSIATYQAPGRYLLKDGVEKDTSTKPSSDIGSSPESLHIQTPIAEPESMAKLSTEEPEKHDQLSSKVGEQPNALEERETHSVSPDEVGDNKKMTNSEGTGGSSSSDSDSESESASSDSGSDSGSHSRSRSKSPSPAGSGSPSTSDSESDGTSSSSEEPDVDVDIMSDEGEADDKLGIPVLTTSTSPITRISHDDGFGRDHDGANKNDGYLETMDINSEDVEICDYVADFTKALSPNGKNKTSSDHETDMAANTNVIPPVTDTELLEQKVPSHSPDPYKQLDRERDSYGGRLVADVVNDMRETMAKDVSGHDLPGNLQRASKVKSKRGPDVKHAQDNSENLKRSKADVETENIAQSLVHEKSKETYVSERQHLKSPAKFEPGPNKKHLHSTQMAESLNRDGSAEPSVRGRKAPDNVDVAVRNASNFGKGSGHVERGSMTSDTTGACALKNSNLQHERAHNEILDEEREGSKFFSTKSSRENIIGERISIGHDPQNKKSSEQTGKRSKEQSTQFTLTAMPKDNRKDGNRRGSGKESFLRRELSDLELGEFREPAVAEEAKKQLEKSNSFKLSQSKRSPTDLDRSKGRNTGKVVQEPKRLSPMNQENELGKRMLEDEHLESTNPHQNFRHSQATQRADLGEFDSSSHLDKFLEKPGRGDIPDMDPSHGMALESNFNASKKRSSGLSNQQDAKAWSQGIPNNVQGSKSTNTSSMTGSGGKRKERSWMEHCNGSKKRNSLSDDDKVLYAKYEKDEPELRGPIKDDAQYKEYTKEYSEKHSCYSSLYKLLESERADFEKFRRDLEHAKDRDMDSYNNIVERIIQSYRLCGPGHIRMKKVFIVLHKELQLLRQRIEEYAATHT